MANIRWQAGSNGPNLADPHRIMCFNEDASWPSPLGDAYNAYYLGYVRKRRGHWQVVTWAKDPRGPQDTHLRCIWAAKTMDEAQAVLLARALLDTPKE